MKKEKSFLQTVCSIAIPVTLQCMLQSSFSMADQIMIGQLGSVSIAGVGLAGKFTSIFNVLVSAIAAVAGIMIAQYMGKKDEKAVDSSFSVNLLVAAVLAVLFTGACTLFPGQIMGIYTTDKGMIQESAGYLRVIAITFLPIVGSTLFATLLRCMEKAVLPFFTTTNGEERSGMGFTIMQTFMSDFSVQSEKGQGTTVQMSKRIKAEIAEEQERVDA